jgi:hypothetical protein
MLLVSSSKSPHTDDLDDDGVDNVDFDFDDLDVPSYTFVTFFKQKDGPSLRNDGICLWLRRTGSLVAQAILTFAAQNSLAYRHGVARTDIQTYIWNAMHIKNSKRRMYNCTEGMRSKVIHISADVPGVVDELRHGITPLSLFRRMKAQATMGHPFAKVFLFTVNQSSTIRAKLLIDKMLGSWMLAALFFVASEGAQAHGNPSECQDAKSIKQQVVKFILIGAMAKLPMLLLLFAIGLLQRHEFVTHDLWTDEERHRQIRKWSIKEWLLFWLPGILFNCFCIVFLILFVANVSTIDLEKWAITVGSVLIQTFVVMPIISATLTTAFTSVIAACNPSIVDALAHSCQLASTEDAKSTPCRQDALNSHCSDGGGFDCLAPPCQEGGENTFARDSQIRNSSPVACVEADRAQSGTATLQDTNTGQIGKDSSRVATPLRDGMGNEPMGPKPRQAESSEALFESMPDVHTTASPYLASHKLASQLGDNPERYFVSLSAAPVSRDILQASSKQVSYMSAINMVDGLSLEFISLRCEDEEISVRSGETCKFCLPVSTFDLRVRINCTGLRPFSAFNPRLLCAGGLEARSPVFTLCSSSSQEGWLRLCFPACLEDGRRLKGSVSVGVGGGLTNVPTMEATLPFELQCRFNEGLAANNFDNPVAPGASMKALRDQLDELSKRDEERVARLTDFDNPVAPGASMKALRDQIGELSKEMSNALALTAQSPREQELDLSI